MKKGGVGHSLQGSWQGRYFYSRGDAHGFEAVFIDMDGHIEGNILDEGCLGEAQVSGRFGYPSLSFTKTYLKKIMGAVPINYRGTMSEDGKMLSGSWSTSNNSGSWLAVRLDDREELKFQEWNETVAADGQQPQTTPQKSSR